MRVAVLFTPSSTKLSKKAKAPAVIHQLAKHQIVAKNLQIHIWVLQIHSANFVLPFVFVVIPNLMAAAVILKYVFGKELF
jgi:hypothetical protein